MFEIEPKPLDRIVDDYFRRHRDLQSAQRRAVADAAFGVARWLRRLDGLLVLRGVRKPSHGDRAGLFLEMGTGIESVSREGFPSSDAAYHSLPDFLYEMMCEQYGIAGAAEIAGALNRQQRPTVRINSSRIDREDALRRLAAEGIEAERTGRSPFGIRLSRRVHLRSLGPYTDGLIEVQDEASQLAVVLASPSSGDKVLDACAGAGGKGLMMSMLMGRGGRIVSVDTDAMKLHNFKRRARRARAGNIEVTDPESLEDMGVLASFDVVFIDAPCTGTGTIRRAPDLKWRIDRGVVEERVREQGRILEGYAGYVKPGGRLVYATCSILAKENEGVVERFLSRGGFERIDAGAALKEKGIDTRGLVSQEGHLRADPRAGEWDGFFAAVMRKK